MTDAAILGMSGSFLGLCGIIIAAIISRKKSSTNGFIRKETCDAVKEGITASLDALWTEFRSMDEKVDRILLLMRG